MCRRSNITSLQVPRYDGDVSSRPPVPPHENRGENRGTTLPALSPTNERLLRLSTFTEFKRTIIFVKIMVKLMELHDESLTTIRDVNRTLALCINRAKAGDENFLPVEEAIIVRVQTIVTNPIYWGLTRDYLGYNCG